MMRTWLRAFAWWIINRWPDVVEDRARAWRLLAERKYPEDEIDRALRAAFVEAGVAVDSFDQDADLGGKRYEVLHHAAIKLGNPLRTVADIKRLLE